MMGVLAARQERRVFRGQLRARLVADDVHPSMHSVQVLRRAPDDRPRGG
jgi:hypothetical protein